MALIPTDDLNCRQNLTYVWLDMGVLNMAYRMERTVLVILVWGLLLETFVLVYFCIFSQTWRFEFHYTLILFIVTFMAVIVLLIQAYIKLRRFKKVEDFQVKCRDSKLLYSS